VNAEEDALMMLRRKMETLYILYNVKAEEKTLDYDE
jgi:hypothetical protein